MAETRDPNLITLYELNNRLLKCQIEADEQARKVRSAKQAVDAAVSELSEHIARMNEHLPLFDGPAEPEAPEPVPEGLPAEKDDWKQVPLRSLPGLTANMLERLEAVGIITVGDVGNYDKEHVGLEDIKGFGPKKVELLYQSLDQFWDEWTRLHPGVESSDAIPNDQTTEPIEAMTQNAEPWETVILRNYMSAKLADLISQETEGECQTFGDLAEFLRDGHDCSILAPDHGDELLTAVEKFRRDRKWADDVTWPNGFPAEWLKIEA